MASEIHKNDVGTRFLITIQDDSNRVDLRAATLRQVDIKNPSGTILNKTASVLSSGSAESGVMYYDTIAGDLELAGIYKLQGKVSIPSGTYYTDIYTFKVSDNLGG